MSEHMTEKTQFSIDDELAELQSFVLVETGHIPTTLAVRDVRARVADLTDRLAAAEVDRDATKTALTSVHMAAERASRKGYELDPNDVLEMLGEEPTDA